MKDKENFNNGLDFLIETIGDLKSKIEILETEKAEFKKSSEHWTNRWIEASGELKTLKEQNNE